MWKKEKDEYQHILMYELNKIPICAIFVKETVKDDQVNPAHWYDGVHKGRIYLKGVSLWTNSSSPEYWEISDKNLDVLKLKCLLRA